MAEFLQALLQFPTLIFGGMLGVSLVYWLFIIVGMADLNPFDGADGAVKGALEGAANSAADGAGEAVSAVKGASGLADALAFFGLTKVPITISFSLFSLFAWFLSFATRHALDPILPNVLSALAATAAGVGGGFFLTSAITKPLSGLFEEGKRPGGQALIGRTVKVTTEVVDHERGQGEIEDGAGGITVTIRCEKGTTLRRGDECVVMDVDVEAGIYTVAPMKVLLPEEQLAQLQKQQEQQPVAVPNASTDRKPS